MKIQPGETGTSRWGILWDPAWNLGHYARGGTTERGVTAPAGPFPRPPSPATSCRVPTRGSDKPVPCEPTARPWAEETRGGGSGAEEAGGDGEGEGEPREGGDRTA